MIGEPILDHHPSWKRTNSTEQEPCHADLHQESQSCVSGAGGASSLEGAVGVGVNRLNR
jgi:hypothetical protein